METEKNWVPKKNWGQKFRPFKTIRDAKQTFLSYVASGEWNEKN